MRSVDPFAIGTVELTPQRRVEATFEKHFFGRRSFEPLRIPRALTANGGTVVFRPTLDLPDELRTLLEIDDDVVRGGVLRITGLDAPAPERDTAPTGYVLELAGPPNRIPVAEPRAVEWSCRIDREVTDLLQAIIAQARRLDERLAGRGGNLEPLEPRATEFVREVLELLLTASHDDLAPHVETLASRLSAVLWFLGRSAAVETSMRSATELHEKACKRFMANLTNALVEVAFVAADKHVSWFWDELGSGTWSRSAMRDVLKESTEKTADAVIDGVRKPLTARLGEIDDTLMALDPEKRIAELEESVAQLAPRVERLRETLRIAQQRFVAAVRAQSRAGARAGARSPALVELNAEARAAGDLLVSQLDEIDVLRHADASRLEEALRLTREREAIEAVMARLGEAATETGPARLQQVDAVLGALNDTPEFLARHLADPGNLPAARQIETLEAAMAVLADPAAARDAPDAIKGTHATLETMAELTTKLREIEVLKRAPAEFEALEAIASQLSYHPSKSGFKITPGDDPKILKTYIEGLRTLGAKLGITRSEADSLYALVSSEVEVIGEAIGKRAASIDPAVAAAARQDLFERAKAWHTPFTDFMNEQAEGAVNDLLMQSQAVAEQAKADPGPPKAPPGADTSEWDSTVGRLVAGVFWIGGWILGKLWDAVTIAFEIVVLAITFTVHLYGWVADNVVRFVYETSGRRHHSYVEPDPAAEAQLRSRLASVAGLDARFYEIWPEVTVDEVNALRLPTIIQDVKRDGKGGKDRKIARYATDTEMFTSRQWQFGAAAILELCRSALSIDVLDRANVRDVSSDESTAGLASLGAFDHLEQVRTGLADAFAMTDAYDDGKQGLIANFVDTATRTTGEADLFGAWGDDLGLSWHDWDWIIDWIAWTFAWFVRAVGVIAALGVAIGTIGSGTLGAGAVLVGALGVAGVADVAGAVLKGAIAGLMTVPATARLRDDALISVMSTFDDVLGEQ